jgi:hypothetical protein
MVAASSLFLWLGCLVEQVDLLKAGLGATGVSHVGRVVVVDQSLRLGSLTREHAICRKGVTENENSQHLSSETAKTPLAFYCSPFDLVWLTKISESQ